MKTKKQQQNQNMNIAQVAWGLFSVLTLGHPAQAIAAFATCGGFLWGVSSIIKNLN